MTDCSDTLVIGCLKAALVQAEMPLRWSTFICLRCYANVSKVNHQLNFLPIILYYVTFSQGLPSSEFDRFCISHIDR